MFKLVIWMILHVPGPVMGVTDASGGVHDVLMDTTSFKLEVRDFDTIADCQSFSIPGWTYTDSNGVSYQMTVDPNPSEPPKCVRQT